MQKKQKKQNKKNIKTLKPLSQLLKVQNIGVLFQDLRSIVNGRKYERLHYIKRSPDVELNLTELLRFIETKNFRKHLFEEILKEVTEKYSHDVGFWFMNILMDYKTSDLFTLDVIWENNLNVKEVKDSFNSSYGSHDTVTYEIDFEFNSKKYKTSIEKSIVGYAF